MSKKIDPQAILAKLTPLVARLKQYATFTFLLVNLAILGFLILRIRGYVTSEPSDASVNEKLQQINSPKIDQVTADKLQHLEDTNVQVHTLFKQARDNPFQE